MSFDAFFDNVTSSSNHTYSGRENQIQESKGRKEWEEKGKEGKEEVGEGGVLEKDLKVTLRGYQKAAVDWMVGRELLLEVTFPFYVSISYCSQFDKYLFWIFSRKGKSFPVPKIMNWTYSGNNYLCTLITLKV